MVDEKDLLRHAYAEKAPKLIRDEVIRALCMVNPSEQEMSDPGPEAS